MAKGKKIFLGMLLVISGFACISYAADGNVSMLQSDSNSFVLQSGDYIVSFLPPERKTYSRWITIARKGYENVAIGTKLVNGAYLDITDTGEGEGLIYGWKEDRKDAKIFRSLQVNETPETIEIKIISERRWASFDSKLIAYKKYPGLLHWQVKVNAKNDAAFADITEPDCHFMTRLEDMKAEYVPDRHQAARYMTQRGPASGIVYFNDQPMKSFVFYFEDFSSMNEIYKLTGCDQPYSSYAFPGQPGAVKMGTATHEFQFCSADGNNIIPPKAFEEKFEYYTKFGYERPALLRVKAGDSLTFGDTYLFLKPAEKTDNVSVCKNFVQSLSDIYQFIYKPPMIETDWAKDVVPQMIKDISKPENSCWYKEKYFFPRAYVKYEVEDKQLWTLFQILHPLTEYVKKYPNDVNAVEMKKQFELSLPLYYDEAYKGFYNDLPPMNAKFFYHSVYLFNNWIGVADLAQLGNKDALRMMTGLRDRLVQMGKAFDYVFADVWLEDFSKQKGHYIYDTTGAYVYCMMSLYELSENKDTECLESAKKAAEKLTMRCMDLMWEINMTASGAAGCEKLYKATGDERYRDIAYIPLANALRWAWLWECDYGFGENATTFFAFCATPACTASAEYETHRTRYHLKQYQQMAKKDLPETVNAILTDSWKRGPVQSRSAMPPLMVKDGAGKYLAQGNMESACGEVNPNQMIPLEDFKPGWGTALDWWYANAKQGITGQEVYGAGGPIWYAVWQDEK